MANAQPTRKHDPRGFTLMELLVSITVISLLAVTILFSWRVAATAWGRADRLIDAQRRETAAHQVLEMQMAEMVPVMPWLRRGNSAVFFQGGARAARFLSRYSLASRSRSGLYRIEYEIADGPNGSKQLLLNEAPVLATDELDALWIGTEQTPDGPRLQLAPIERTPQTRVLLEGLADARFEYYQPAGAGAGGWVSEWTGAGNELPRAMAIRTAARRADDNHAAPLSIVASIENFSKALR
jgi:prepilin-type N-terminal cleavage/methylation domain-containing protein